MVTTYEEFDINAFKSEIINVICENPKIIALIDEDYVDAGGALLNSRIFPYIRIPKTIEQSPPYVCFKVDHIRNANTYLETIDVTMYIVCHEKEMDKQVYDFENKLPLSGTIIDILGEEMKKTLCGLDTKWIGELRLYSNTEEILSYEYPCRVLVFTAFKESYANYK